MKKPVPMSPAHRSQTCQRSRRREALRRRLIVRKVRAGFYLCLSPGAQPSSGSRCMAPKILLFRSG